MQSMSVESTPMQGEEGGKGSSPLVLEHKIGETEALVEAIEGGAVKKPLVEVHHKRKASRDIPYCRSISIPFSESELNNHNSQHVNSPPISPPTEQLDDQLVLQDEGEEINEKDEGTEKSPNHVEQETEVEANAIEKIEMEPYTEEVNNEVEAQAMEKIEVALYTNEVVSSLMVSAFREPKGLHFDLNELPPEENED